MMVEAAIAFLALVVVVLGLIAVGYLMTSDRYVYDDEDLDGDEFW